VLPVGPPRPDQNGISASGRSKSRDLPSRRHRDIQARRPSMPRKRSQPRSRRRARRGRGGCYVELGRGAAGRPAAARSERALVVQAVEVAGSVRPAATGHSGSAHAEETVSTATSAARSARPRRVLRGARTRCCRSARRREIRTGSRRPSRRSRRTCPAAAIGTFRHVVREDEETVSTATSAARSARPRRVLRGARTRCCRSARRREIRTGSRRPGRRSRRIARQAAATGHSGSEHAEETVSTGYLILDGHLTARSDRDSRCCRSARRPEVRTGSRRPGRRSRRICPAGRRHRIFRHVVRA
jgi:hypothetical protein